MPLKDVIILVSAVGLIMLIAGYALGWARR